jgi:histidinol-phosphate phosphatase family protein
MIAGHAHGAPVDSEVAVMSLHFGVLGSLDVPLAFGALRLSTEGRPAREEAQALIQQALDSGVRVLDTADSYALADTDMHYGEALVRDALASWNGPRDEVRIITKVGMARPKGRWMPNARPGHLRKQVDGSLAALKVERLFLLLLHGNDPGTPFEDSLATLAELQRSGKIQHLGLCNVDIAEVRQAQRHFDVCAIQNELSVMNRKSAVDGTLQLARELGIPFLAHRPLGGHAKTENLLKNRAMKPIATKHGISPHRAALACLLDLGAPVLPLFGTTRADHLHDALAATSVRLDASDRAGLLEKISFDADADARRHLETISPPPIDLSDAESPGSTPEVVIVMGIQGAGKSTLVQRYLAAGYERLNRDLAGGTLDDLLAPLESHLQQGRTRIVLDNTYPTRASRWPLIRMAHRYGVPVRCHHLATPLDEALINVVLRVLDRYESLPGPDELKELGKSDPNLPPPAALSRFAACLEPPTADEGFAAITVTPFVRLPGPSLNGTQKALFLDVDGTLRRTLSGDIYPRDPADIEVLPGRSEVLRRYVDDGWQLFFVSNQSGIASGNVSLEAVQAGFAKTRELLGVPIADVAFCPHTAFPAGCFCRKPMPGLGVWLARRHGLSLRDSIMVGDMDSDAGFARAIGARFVSADAFFAGI